MAKQHTRIGIVGTCPVCEGEFHVQSGTMVHHGFERPGHGSIVGDCWAVGREPFEVSCKATQEYRAIIAQQLTNAALHLSDLVEGRIKTLHKDVSVYGYKFGRRTIIEPKYEEYTSTETDLARRYEWKRLFDHAKFQAESHVRMLQISVDRLDRMVARWEPKPLREVTEEVLLMEKAELEARKNARAAAAQAKRDAENAKRAAREAKEKAAEDAVNSFYAEWGQKFAELAKEGPEAATKARVLQDEMRKAAKKAKLRYHYKDHVDAAKMGQDEALATLKLAYKSNGYFNYIGFGY